MSQTITVKGVKEIIENKIKPIIEDSFDTYFNPISNFEIDYTTYFIYENSFTTIVTEVAAAITEEINNEIDVLELKESC